MMQGTQQPAQPALVGMSLPRQDGPDKVTGRTRYAGDQVLPGLLYARLVMSPYAHARILNINTSAALSLPGIVAVFSRHTPGGGHADPPSAAPSPPAQQKERWGGTSLARLWR